MAYGTRYSCEWRSPMRDKYLYRISILERDYTGDAEAIYPTGSVLDIQQGQLDDDEFVAIKGSQATLQLLCRDEGDPYLALFTTDPMRYKLLVESYRTSKWEKYWEGYLSTSSYSQEWRKPPYKVQLRAVDGLALLKDMPWMNGSERFIGIASVADMIDHVIARISDDAVSYAPVSPIYPNQPATTTLRKIGVEAEAIYAMYGDAPTCYDVLDSLLKTLRLQIFQSYGWWRVRSLGSLAAYSPITIGGNVNSTKPFSLDSATTSFSDASLSMIPAYKLLAHEMPATKDADSSPDVTSMLTASRWNNFGADVGLESYKITKALRLRSRRLNAYTTGAYMGGYYLSDAIVPACSNIELSLSLSVYGLDKAPRSNEDPKKLRYGLFVINASDDPLAWLTPDGDSLTINSAVAGWDFDAKVWSALPTGTSTISSIFANRTKEVELSANGIGFRAPKKDADKMEATPIEIACDKIPTAIGDKSVARLRVILVFLGAAGEPMPAIELREPSLSLTQVDEITEAARPSEVEIAKDGLSTINYSQVYGDYWLGLGANKVLEAPLVDLTYGGMLRSTVMPSTRSRLLDAAVADIRTLRSEPIRQLEGDAYTAQLIDLDAKWIDADGRIYYANYIKRLASRGLYHVQLREMPKGTSSAIVVSDSLLRVSYVTAVIGLDDCAYIHASNGRNLYRYDVRTGQLHYVTSSESGTYQLTVNEGQSCVSVVSFDGTFYRLRAYDSQGKVLSDIPKVNSLINISSTLADNVCRSARYDATTDTWVLCGGDAKVTYIWQLSSDGSLIGGATITLTGYLSPTMLRVLPNGYSYVSAPTGLTSEHRCYYHFNHQQVSGEMALYGVDKRIIYANDVYMLQEYGSAIAIYARTDSGINALRLTSVNTSSYSFVQANNALVLVRSSDGLLLRVYDGRSAKWTSLPNLATSADDFVWLSGDTIYALRKNREVYRLAWAKRTNIVL